MNAQQNKALHELIQKVRLTISKLSREYDSALIFKHLLEVLDVLKNINCIHSLLRTLKIFNQSLGKPLNERINAQPT